MCGWLQRPALSGAQRKILCCGNQKDPLHGTHTDGLSLSCCPSSVCVERIITDLSASYSLSLDPHPSQLPSSQTLQGQPRSQPARRVLSAFSDPLWHSSVALNLGVDWTHQGNSLTHESPGFTPGDAAVIGRAAGHRVCVLPQVMLICHQD